MSNTRIVNPPSATTRVVGPLTGSAPPTLAPDQMPPVSGVPSEGATWLFVVGFGAGSLSQTIRTAVHAWSKFGTLWVPRLIGLWQWTLGDTVGLTGHVPGPGLRFAHTVADVSAAVPAPASWRFQRFVSTTTTDIAAVRLDIAGAFHVTVTPYIVTASSAGALVTVI